LQKTDVLDLNLIELLQNQQGCNLYGPQCTFIVITDLFT